MNDLISVEKIAQWQKLKTAVACEIRKLLQKCTTLLCLVRTQRANLYGLNGILWTAS